MNFEGGGSTRRDRYDRGAFEKETADENQVQKKGLDERLTVTRTALPDWLERTLATTHAMENLNGSLRRITERVETAQWCCAGSRLSLTEPSKAFRKLRGYKGTPNLLAALRTHDAALD